MKNSEIKIKQKPSSLSEFVKKPLANDEEISAFEEYAASEAKEEEIKDSLAKIYEDERGHKIDIKTLTVKRGRGFFFNLFTFIIILFALAGAAYGAYNYLIAKINVPEQPVSLEFNAKKEAISGEEFYYSLNFKNNDNIAISNLEIKAEYPANFIFVSSEPAPAKNNNLWRIGSLASRRGDLIKIKGKFIGPLNSNNVILADLTYKPENFSSEFKKSASFETKIKKIGVEISLINSSSAMLKENNEITVKFQALEQNYINNFRISLSYPEEAEIVKNQPENQKSATSSPGQTVIKTSGPDSWLISNLNDKENELKIIFKVKEKKQPAVKLKLKFEAPAAPGDQQQKYYLFYEKELDYEIINSDLNIGLIINGSPLDQAVNFGQTLNYSINYSNKGETAMKDVIIMAVMDGDFLDWQSLGDKNNGQLSGNSISWSKNEISDLAEIKSGGEGAIDFSLNVKSQGQIDLSNSYQIKSYVKYSLGGKNAGEESQSNIIINKINSDLNLKEELRYFSDDNLAVGSGPLPPRVGETTSLKVYWTINNNLHELSDLKASLKLPPNIKWDNKNRSSVGNVYYDGSLNQVIWQIGRLPVSVYKADAEFNVSITPTAAERNSIVIILPGTTVGAIDADTGAPISKTLKAKTSKLEDDRMAAGDGVVE